MENKTNINDIDAILPDDFDINNENYSLDNSPEEAPTTEQSTETNVQSETEAATQPAEPTIAPEEVVPATVPQTVKVKFNHEERELSLDEAATYAQKGMNYDRLNEKVQGFEAANARNERLAKRLGYDNASEMMDAAEKNYYNRRVRELVDAGNTEAMAKFLVDQEDKEASANYKAPEVTPSATPKQMPGMTPERKAELDEFIAAYPGVIKIPTEVIEANRNGVRLKDAYSNFMNQKVQQQVNVTPQVSASQSNPEVEKLRQENQILKQNQASAAMAPVTGVTGKPSTDIVDPNEGDPFMKGFNSEQW